MTDGDVAAVEWQLERFCSESGVELAMETIRGLVKEKRRLETELREQTEAANARPTLQTHYNLIRIERAETEERTAAAIADWLDAQPRHDTPNSAADWAEAIRAGAWRPTEAT